MLTQGMYVDVCRLYEQNRQGVWAIKSQTTCYSTNDTPNYVYNVD